MAAPAPPAFCQCGWCSGEFKPPVCCRSNDWGTTDGVVNADCIARLPRFLDYMNDLPRLAKTGKQAGMARSERACLTRRVRAGAALLGPFDL